MAPWTSTEDAQLLAQIARYGTKDQWRQIAEAIPGRTNKACRKRWLHSLCPDVKKTLWTPEEDEKLLAAHNMYPGRWAIIARHIDGRTDDACSKRYREALDPSLCRNEWTPEEDQRLLREVETWKTQWSKVGHAMNRSGLACRNRYRILQRKKDAPVTSDPPFEWPANDNVSVDSYGDSYSMDRDISVSWSQHSFHESPLLDPFVTQTRSTWQPRDIAAEFAIDPVLENIEPFRFKNVHLPLDGPSTGVSPLPVSSLHDGPFPVETQSMDAPYSPRALNEGLQDFYGAAPVEDQSDEVAAFPADGDACEALEGIDDAVPPAIEHTQMQIDDDDDVASVHPRPTKRRRTSNPVKRRRAADDARHAADSCRLSATRSVTADAAILAYACGSGACWSAVEAEMSAGLTTSPGCVRFATSAELLVHKKTLHPCDESDKLYRCGLPGCNKCWKNVNGLQYHLQVSRAHFQIAVNRAKSAASVDPEVDADGGRPKKPFQCPHDGCPNSYKQLNGLRYHLTHGHPENVPVQLDELPLPMRRRLASARG